ncbi:hypothetical protein Rhopal_005136-T1 [Rhodotorula paludigena]|uniref:AAA protein C-terminal winged helix domain-containing protein n=1 Tax=Rhodotorula paludigena TaxID=86838 RepID=A0AAV5GSW2_9BASI|nr:hypothetical protein Rhopal_005136-T1 [Rhodotorula paludigena]
MLPRAARPLLRPLLLQRFTPQRPWAARAIANNAVAPQVGYQVTQYDIDKDDREAGSSGGANGGAGGPGGPERGGGGGGAGGNSAWDSAIATAGGILLVAGAGLCYHYWYKWEVLRKIERAFARGYDPVLELARATARESDGTVRKGRVRRKEQDYIDKVINGEISGEYLLIMGPKGVGKTSMLLDAMIANEADGCAMLEAHEDPEVVRLRLGKALDFEYNEDSFAGLFQRRDPREAGPILDIERALAKLEKAAIRFRKRRNRPMVLILQNSHFIHDDEDGHALLHMLQQRAESWAQAGVLTTIFLTDNFHVYAHLKRSATRMHVLSIRDLTPFETHTFLSGTHARLYPDKPPVTKAQSLRIWDLIGGRLSYLSKVVKRDDMEEAALGLVQEEKEWLLSRLGMIPDHDDDVMDSMKEASCSFLLFQEFAKRAERASPEMITAVKKIEEPLDAEETKEAIELDLLNVLPDELDPKVTYGEARIIMTRPDYIVDLDAWHIINVDRYHHVRPDSRLMLSAFKDIVSQEGFQEDLDTTRDRVDAIESLHRTRELTVKTGDGDLGGFLRLRVGDLLPQHEKREDDDEEDDDGEDAVGGPEDLDGKGSGRAPGHLV